MSENIKDKELNGFLEHSDARETQEFLIKQSEELSKKLDAVSDKNSLERAKILISLANSELGRNKMEDAWTHARQAFDLFISYEYWEDAVECCDILYQTELPSSIAALGHGVWLSVTFPISVQHSINMLNHIIEETPDDSDGAALAAVVAHYVVDLRCQDKEKEDHQFITMNMLSKVAKRHSNVETQSGLNVWMDKLQLKEPDIFLPRFALVLGAIVEDKWWFDRDLLRTKIPD